MKTMKLLGLATFVIVAGSVVAAAKPPAVPATPAGVDAIVYARPFRLTTGYQFEWRKEKPTIKEGMILVLRVNPDLVYPRQSAEPVLYVGAQTAERLNVGYQSGFIVAIAPGNPEKLDLSKTLIWFGTPDLPERVDAARITAERKKARKAGIKPLRADAVGAAVKAGGARLDVADRHELGVRIADVIEKYSPQESDLIDALRVPKIH